MLMFRTRHGQTLSSASISLVPLILTLDFALLLWRVVELYCWSRLQSKSAMCPHAVPWFVWESVTNYILFHIPSLITS